MGHNWKSKNQFRIFSSELSRTENRDFERAILSYLRLVFPTAYQAQPMGGLDRCGVDVVVPGEGDVDFSLGIQCKGFGVTEAELGKDQVRQCRDSVQTFADSALAVEQYWLVHNRKLTSAAFHTAVMEQVRTLEATGRVAKARLLNHEDFFVEILDLLYARFRRFVSERARGFRERSGGLLGVPEWPIEEVPYQLGKCG